MSKRIVESVRSEENSHIRLKKRHNWVKQTSSQTKWGNNWHRFQVNTSKSQPIEQQREREKTTLSRRWSIKGAEQSMAK